MRKLPFLLSAALLSVAGSGMANNVLIDQQTSSNPLPGTKKGEQREWTSSEFSNPDGHKVIRLTFKENIYKNHKFGWPFVSISEFYLYDKNGEKVTLAASNFSSNATQEDDGGGLAVLCDGNTNAGNYWHSAWKYDAKAYHYLQIDATGTNADLSKFKVGYITRNENEAPTEIQLTTAASKDAMDISMAMPMEGQRYYFYNKRKTGGDRYYYVSNGNIGFAEANDRGKAAYMWVCEKTEDGKYAFKNEATQKYFGWQKLSDTAFGWTLDGTVSDQNVKNKGFFTLKGLEKEDTEKFLVGKADKFDQAEHAGYYDDTFSSDFGFTLTKDVPNMPVVGVNYYFYNEHMSGDTYYYDNDGQVGFGTEKAPNAYYVWTCVDAGQGKLAFKNMKTGRFFSWKSLATSQYGWTVSATMKGNTNSGVYNEGCVTIRSPKENKFLVGKVSGDTRGFDQADRAEFNNATFSSDFCFETCTTDFSANKATDFIGATYGEKWVRLKWKTNQNHAAGFAAGEDGKFSGRPAKSNEGDLTSIEQVWTLVGNEKDGFLLQNKAAGDGLALHVANTNSGTAATMVEKAKACKWKLVNKSSGIYAITPANATGVSLNAYGGELQNLKLYDANGDGSQWAPECVVEGLTMSIKVNGDDSFIKHKFGIGDLKFTVDYISTTSRVKGSSEAATYYLPNNVKVVLEESDVFRGYTKGNFTVNGETKDKVEFTTGTNIGTVVCNFNADPESGEYLYISPDAKGKPYRIPAIATAPNGDVFAISDNRPCGSDIGYGEVDIKCRISKDHGKTWGEEFFIADGVGDNNGDQVWKTGFGDAAIVADAERNELLVMMVCGKTVCWNGDYKPNDPTSNPNRVARVRAKLNPATGEWEWTKPVEVTESVYSIFVDENNKPTVQSLFIGSGRICQSRVTKVGAYYRLYCSVWTKNEGNRVIYSDDFGETWNVLGKISDRPGRGGDEPKCEELPDGSVILSSRRNGRLFNIYRYKDVATGEGEWLGEVNSEGQPGGIKVGNSTNGEIMLVKAIRKSDNAKVELALQSVPFGNGRKEVGFFFKEITEDQYDNVVNLASNWTKGLQVSYKDAAYSTMTLQKDHRIGFFFEEVPGGYCMVYVPLTIEKITSDAYMLDKEAYPFDPTGTGIEQVIPSADAANAPIYDLSGRRVLNPVKKGIYIQNGKKYVIK